MMYNMSVLCRFIDGQYSFYLFKMHEILMHHILRMLHFGVLRPCQQDFNHCRQTEKWVNDYDEETTEPGVGLETAASEFKSKS